MGHSQGSTPTVCSRAVRSVAVEAEGFSPTPAATTQPAPKTRKMPPGNESLILGSKKNRSDDGRTHSSSYHISAVLKRKFCQNMHNVYNRLSEERCTSGGGQPQDPTRIQRTRESTEQRTNDGGRCQDPLFTRSSNNDRTQGTRYYCELFGSNMEALAEELGMSPLQPLAKRARDAIHSDTVHIHTELHSEAADTSAARARQ